MLYGDFVATVCYEIQVLSRTKDLENNMSFSYHIFILIAVGIEMLGTGMDGGAWHLSSLSKKRFNSAIKNIPSLRRYRGLNLYQYLRSGIAHNYLPQRKVILSTYLPSKRHLGRSGKALILCLEDLLQDFISACDEVIENIDGEKRTVLLGTNAYAELPPILIED